MSLPHSAAPKYVRLYESLREEIRLGRLQPDQQLPTEDHLCRKYLISRGTVRKAYDALSADRLIRREQGRGVFVNLRRPSIGAFSVEEGPLRSSPSVQVVPLRLEVVPAELEIARRLGLTRGSPVIHAVQVQSREGRPILHEERYLDESLCPGLPDDDLQKTPVHWLLIHKYKIPLVRVTHDIRAGRASRAIASLLSLDPGSPVFSIDRLTYTPWGRSSRIRPAVLYKAWCRADDYHFHAEFQSFL